MKIGHYDSELWERGGVANYVRRIGAAQVAQGHEVIYFSLHPPVGRQVEFDPFIPVLNTAELFAQAEAMGLDILHLHKAMSPPLPTKVPLIRTLHGHHPYCPSGGRYLKRWQKPCDRAYHPLGCLWGYAVDRCGSLRPATLQDNFRHTHIERQTLPHIPVMAVSGFLKEQLVRSGYPADKIQVLHLFAPSLGDCNPPPTAGVPRFLFLGRVTSEKGLGWLLRSLHQVTQPVHLDIAGEGEHLDAMRGLVQTLGLHNRVTFHGWVDAPTVKALIQSARALIFPSVWHEPGGTVAFEAMAHARAVIMSRVGGMPEVIQTGANGLLVEPWDTAALATAIDTLAQDVDLAKRLGQQGYERVTERFTLDYHLAQLMDAYTEIAAPL
jgi:glycosyltransferase involved in cell wall biosynthesis